MRLVFMRQRKSSLLAWKSKGVASVAMPMVIKAKQRAGPAKARSHAANQTGFNCGLFQQRRIPGRSKQSGGKGLTAIKCPGCADKAISSGKCQAGVCHDIFCWLSKIGDRASSLFSCRRCQNLFFARQISAGTTDAGIHPSTQTSVGYQLTVKKSGGAWRVRGRLRAGKL